MLGAVGVAVENFGELMGARGRVVARAFLRERRDYELVEPRDARAGFASIARARLVLICWLLRGLLGQVRYRFVEPLNEKNEINS